MRNKNIMRGIILTSLFVFAALTSCVDNLPAYDELQTEFPDGYSLNLTVTLDKMGGTRAGGSDSDMDDYIDPEKFRVLFFNDKEQFLFESKSRWIKQLAPTGEGYSQWLVSVPMYEYGNDVGEEWDFDKIREALTDNSFQIAILANRPGREYYPGFSNTGLESDPKWIDNKGPYWGKEHTIWGYEKEDSIRTIFDLHHCQYDPIYHGKSWEPDSNDKNYYDFIMGDYPSSIDNNLDEYKEIRPKMGATSSWVYWGDENLTYPGENIQELDDDFPEAFVKYSILPDKEHPIPMYGTQKFEAIGKDRWIKGTPFNLSKITPGAEQQEEYNFKSIALLRSVVKLELLISKTLFTDEPKLVTLWYSNVYARCEPMNVWDPTDEIWKDQHDVDCEWIDIMNYGPVSSNRFSLNGEKRNTNSKQNYQKTMSWFYGAWTKIGPDGEPRWTFDSDIAPSEKEGVKYPNIFNPSIQRNKMVLCSKTGLMEDDNYWRYVVYTGERNMNDPNKLPQMDGSAYSISWMFRDGRKTPSGKYYFIPIADYNTSTGNSKARECLAPVDQFSNYNLAGNIANYANNLKDVDGINEMPWPLLRNHVYKIYIGGNNSTRADGEPVLTVTSEDLHSESIKFD